MGRYNFVCKNLDELNEELLSKAMGIEKERIVFYESNDKYASFPIYNSYIIETDLKAMRKEFEEDKDIPFFDEESKTWRVKLSKQPDDTFYEKCIKTVGLEKYELERDGFLHRGHYLAEKFCKFLLPQGGSGKGFFKDNTKNNMYYQTCLCNGNGSGQYKYNFSDMMTGQLRYEQLVYEYFKKNDKDVYYEIQDVRDPENNEKSLGRRILLLFPKKGYHVFIPNVDSLHEK